MVARYYHRRNWHPGAIDRLEQILREDPTFTGRDAVYYYMADSLQKSEREDEALEWFERLLEEYPQSEFVEDATESLAELRLSAQAAER